MMPWTCADETADGSFAECQVLSRDRERRPETRGRVVLFSRAEVCHGAQGG